MTLRSSGIVAGSLAASAFLVLLAVTPLTAQQAPVSILDILKAPPPEPAPAPAAAAPAAPAAPAPGAEQAPVFRASIQLVNMSVTVTDNKGKFLAGLTKEDFVVLEDNQQREIVNFRAITGSKDSPLPIGLGLILDLSTSLSNDEWGIARVAAEMIAKKYLTNGDELYAIGFHRAPILIHGVSTDQKAVMDAVRRAKRDNSTALYDAIAMGLEEAGKATHKKQVMVILTDGEDTASQLNIQQVADMARKSEVVIYGLVVGRDQSVGQRGDLATVRRAAGELQRITDASGGRTMVIEGFSQLEDAFSNVGKDFTAQYEIAFERGESDGKYHNVRVGVRRKEVAVRHRLGYVAD